MSIDKELEKMKRKHEYKMKKLRLKGELDIEENKVKNETKFEKLMSEKNQLGLTNEIRALKTIVKQDKVLIRSGKFLELWGTLATIISTLLTIAGLWSYFNNSWLSLITFISAIVLVQFSVFILSKQDTTIKKSFMQHAFKVILLKSILLFISIYGNTVFFLHGREFNFITVLTTLLLCISIDVIAIFVVAIAQDFKTLNKNACQDSLYKGILSKVFYNATFKVFESIENKYMQNKTKTLDSKINKTLEKLEVKEDIQQLEAPKDNIRKFRIKPKKIDTYSPLELEAKNNNYVGDKEENTSLEIGKYEFRLDKDLSDDLTTKNKIGFNYPEKFKSNDMTNVKIMGENDNIENKVNTENKEVMTQDYDKEFSIEDVKKYLKYMFENSSGNISIGQSKIKANTNLTDKQIRFIRGYLELLEIIKIDGKTTYILTDYATAIKKVFS